MIRFVFPLAMLAIAMNGTAYAESTAGREFADIQKFARESAHAVEPQSHLSHGVGSDMVSTKKVGGLDVSKLIPGPRTPAASGKAIGGRANEGRED